MTTAWPERPDVWPDILKELEVCQMLRLDEDGRSPKNARQILRRWKRKHGFPKSTAGGMYKRSWVDSWMDRQSERTA